MKRFTILLLMLSFIVLFVACSEKDKSTNPDPNTPTAPEQAVTPDSTIVVPAEFSAYVGQTVTYNGADVNGYTLTQFVPNFNAFENCNDSTLDCRNLFAVQLIGTDGFTPRPELDLPWSDFATGFILPTADNRTFFPSTDIISRYDVKFMNGGSLLMHRVVTIVKADGTEVPFEVNSLGSEAFTFTHNGTEYAENGIKLSNLITTYMTATPANYNYNFVTLDNYATTPATWAEMQRSYFVTGEGSNHHSAIIRNEDGTRRAKIKLARSIELVAP